MREITELSELKGIQLDIMSKVHAFCVENHISYFLSSGSLIGAVRHKGYIPWDDDIDISMTRENYDKFINLFKDKQESLNLCIANNTTKPYFGRPMMKVFDTRTILYEPDFLYDDPLGVNIDIWPLDGLPKDEEERRRHIKKTKIYRSLMELKNLRFRKQKSIRAKLIHLILLPLPKDYLVNKVVKMAKKYRIDESDYLASFAGAMRPLKKEWVNNLVLAPFEDREFYITADYHDFLLSIYRLDYRILPPPEKRIPHHIIQTYWKD